MYDSETRLATYNTRLRETEFSFGKIHYKVITKKYMVTQSRAMSVETSSFIRRGFI